MLQPKAELNKKQCSLNIINLMLINEAFFVVCVIKRASRTQYNPMNFVTFLRQFLFMLSIFGRGSSLMRGSVIKRMYAGFALIIILFAVTIAIMMGGMHDIHGKFETVSKSSLPLVSLSNQTSVELL
ncbi:hypothetical protein CGH62_19440, partial [Vibrio parahaemolyticus]